MPAASLGHELPPQVTLTTCGPWILLWLLRRGLWAWLVMIGVVALLSDRALTKLQDGGLVSASVLGAGCPGAEEVPFPPLLLPISLFPPLPYPVHLSSSTLAFLKG